MAVADRGRRATCIGVALAALLGAVGVNAQTAVGPADRIGALDRLVGRALAPGELARVHAELNGIASCTQCHAGLESTPDDRCAECHADVAGRMRSATGWHGTFDGPCSGCHAEHRGADADLLGLNRRAFNHELALFPLRGAHARVDCGDCHSRAGDGGGVRFHPIGIDHAACGDCHSDVHRDAFLRGRDCGSCHTEATFAAAGLAHGAGKSGFDHAADAGFALVGRHAAVPCASCHGDAAHERERAEKLAPGRGVSRDCSGCHRDDDPHEGALGAACGSCHTQDGWTGDALRFDHARDAHFALDALHAAVPCSGCHADARFAARSDRCEGCHATEAALAAGSFRDRAPGAPDPHRGAVACDACHADLRAGATLIDYERACATCHAPEYGSLLLSQKRLVDAVVVEAEAELRALELAGARGEEGVPRALRGAVAELDLLARTSAHNPALAEKLARDVRDALRVARAAAR
jgi:hypothetical protein